MRAFAFLVGLIAAAWVSVLYVFTVIAPAASAPELEVAVRCLAGAVLTLVTFSVAETLTLAAIVWVARGPKAIGWVAPTKCRSLFTWLTWSWRYGYEEGLRFCGLEIAIRGKII